MFGSNIVELREKTPMDDTSKAGPYSLVHIRLCPLTLPDYSKQCNTRSKSIPNLVFPKIPRSSRMCNRPSTFVQSPVTRTPPNLKRSLSQFLYEQGDDGLFDFSSFYPATHEDSAYKRHKIDDLDLEIAIRELDTELCVEALVQCASVHTRDCRVQLFGNSSVCRVE